MGMVTTSLVILYILGVVEPVSFIQGLKGFWVYTGSFKEILVYLYIIIILEFGLPFWLTCLYVHVQGEIIWYIHAQADSIASRKVP
jgi:hypothetical protein